MDPIPIHALDRIDEAAETFLQAAGDAKIITFSGEMGAGKTTLIQALCRCLGVPGDVNSPTFALVNEHFTGAGEPVYHMDFYRIEEPEELFDIGYEEYLFSGHYCFIEWPERAGNLIPDDALNAWVVVTGEGSREIRF